MMHRIWAASPPSPFVVSSTTGILCIQHVQIRDGHQAVKGSFCDFTVHAVYDTGGSALGASSRVAKLTWHAFAISQCSVVSIHASWKHMPPYSI